MVTLCCREKNNFCENINSLALLIYNCVTNDGIMTVLEEQVHKLWKFHSEQLKL